MKNLKVDDVVILTEGVGLYSKKLRPYILNETKILKIKNLKATVEIENNFFEIPLTYLKKSSSVTK